jgi:hypothetical protein
MKFSALNDYYFEITWRWSFCCLFGAHSARTSSASREILWLLRFITMFIRARHWFRSRVRWIHYTSSSHITLWSIVIPSTRWYSEWSPSFRFSKQNFVCISYFFPSELYIVHISPSLFDGLKNIWCRVQVIHILVVQFLQPSVSPSILDLNVLKRPYSVWCDVMISRRLLWISAVSFR